MADLTPDQVLVTKIANVALDYDGSFDLAAISRKVPWVSGKISLYPEHLMFVPHRLDAALLPANALKDFGIDIPSISSLHVESRFGIKTIVVQLMDTGPRVGIRCNGAKEFAATLRSLASGISKE